MRSFTQAEVHFLVARAVREEAERWNAICVEELRERLSTRSTRYIRIMDAVRAELGARKALTGSAALKITLDRDYAIAAPVKGLELAACL